ncbi:MAG: hypothetical protein IPN46_14390 [Saprospiraceae bacterium]|nr:hypothetical protein [Saprospiraceae bacterium]
MYDPANTPNHWTSQFFTISSNCDNPAVCVPPTNISSSDITNNNAVLSWDG